MEELITNIHMHTRYSDGEGSHAEISEAALQAGIDVVIVTDHNVYVSGLDGYTERGQRRVLRLIGEEIHDRNLLPQRNHLLVIGGGQELTTYAAQPQQLLHQAQMAEALTFIAHPDDQAMPALNETDIPWENWQVDGFTGIELWNGFSEIKNVAHSKFGAFFFALFPQFMARGPLPATLKRWDSLMADGRRVVAIGGSDAHNYHRQLGPIHRTVFPYEFHFRSINNHLLVPRALTGNLVIDRKMVLTALSRGQSFIGYDLPASTRGFRFTGRCRDGTIGIGGEAPLLDGITFQIRLPSPAECLLLKDGKVLKAWKNSEICTLNVNQPGAYRVECYLEFLGRRRGWIFSNPIYIR